MKRLKFVYKFLAFLLIFSLLLPAGMAQAGKKTNGHEDREKGSLTVHKFEREPGVEDGEAGDGSAGQTVPGDAEPVEGVEFTIKQTHSYDPSNDTWTAITAGENRVGVTGDDGKLTFGDLPLGRYTVEETNAPAHIIRYDEAIIVDIPMTSADGTGVLYDVHIYPKNEIIRGAVSLVKLDGDSNTALQDVVFELYQGDELLDTLTTDESGYVYAKNLAYGSYYFKEISTLPGYVLGNQKIDFFIEEKGSFDEEGNAEGTVVELEAFNYVEPEIEKEVNLDAVNRGETVTYTLTIDLPGDIGSYNSFVVTDELDDRLSYVDGSETVSVPDVFDFEANGQTLSWTVSDFTALEGVGQVTISFDAVVAEDAEPDAVIDNTAIIEFENGHGNGGEKGSNTIPLTPTAGNITVIKLDGDDGSRLLGAEFQLQDEDGNVVRTGTTDSAGTIFFADVDYGTYYLVETKAPDNYNRLRNPIEVTVNADNKNATVEVNNYRSGWQLPRTGGIGTIPFTILGLMIMGSAVYLYVRRRNQVA